MNTQPVLLRFINVPDGRRALDPVAVDRLAESMERIGLQTPITIRADAGGELILVAGAHRFAAAQKLKWKQIDATLIECDAIDAELWEIAENLHRAELTELQRSEQIARWVELVDARVLAQVGPKSPGRPEGGDRKAARELGVKRQAVQRSKKIAGLSSDAKQAAIAAGLDNNQSVLTGAASQPADQQVAYLQAEAEKRKAEQARREAEKHNRNQDRVIAMTEAEHFAEWLMERCDDHDITKLVFWLEGTKPREVIAALRRQAA